MAAIIGIAELPQGKSDLPHAMALHERLAHRALADAGLKLRDVDALLTVSPRADPYLIHAAGVAEHLGIAPAVTLTLEAGGAAPAAMVDAARGMIAAGTAKTVLAIAADMPLGGQEGNQRRNAYVGTLAEVGPVHPDLERPFGPSVPSLFAIVARAHRERYGTREEHLAAVAIQNRRAAALHPNAHYREAFDIAAYHASKLIADPLRLLDCAPVSDGGGAIVITSAERARHVSQNPVNVISSGFSSGHMHLSAAPSLTEFGAGAALEQALTLGHLRRDSIDLALIYDCFTIAMLVNLEDMGFAPKGEAGPAFLEGRFEPQSASVGGGDAVGVPVNTHGGLLSHGHPARAGGMGHLIEAVMQLRGDAGERQLDKIDVALVHGMGGVFATHGVLLLGRN
jgi:acetyl-CoA acetyltransferase